MTAVALVLEEVGQVRQPHVAPVADPVRLRPREELVEQGLVSLLRVLRLPALVAEGEEEVFDEGVHEP